MGSHREKSSFLRRPLILFQRRGRKKRKRKSKSDVKGEGKKKSSSQGGEKLLYSLTQKTLIESDDRVRRRGVHRKKKTKKEGGDVKI